MLNIGHRGAMGYAPENTLKSIRLALDMGVDMVEIDVQLCRTSELVVIHDLSVNRTTNGTGFVKDLSLEDLKQLDAGDNEQIPTLEEVLAILGDRVGINIELKGKGTADRVGQLIYEYIENKGWKKERFLVSSFDHQELKLFKQGYPEIAVGVLIYHLPHDFAKIAVDFKAQSLNASLAFYSKELVDDAHANGLKVLIYTVNEPEDIAICKALGVDGIFTNYPDRVHLLT